MSIYKKIFEQEDFDQAVKDCCTVANYKLGKNIDRRFKARIFKDKWMYHLKKDKVMLIDSFSEGFRGFRSQIFMPIATRMTKKQAYIFMKNWKDAMPKMNSLHFDNIPVIYGTGGEVNNNIYTFEL